MSEELLTKLQRNYGPGKLVAVIRPIEGEENPKIYRATSISSPRWDDFYKTPIVEFRFKNEDEEFTHFALYQLSRWMWKEEGKEVYG